MSDIYDGQSPDLLANADFRLDQLRDSFPCRTCGSLEPAIIEGRFCCDCVGGDAEAFQRTRAARLARQEVAS